MVSRTYSLTTLSIYNFGLAAVNPPRNIAIYTPCANFFSNISTSEYLSLFLEVRSDKLFISIMFLLFVPF